MFLDTRVSDILIRVYSPECRSNLPFNVFVIVVFICYCRPQTCAPYELSGDLLTLFVLYCASSDVTGHGQTYLFFSYPDRTSYHLLMEFLACFRPFCS